MPYSVGHCIPLVRRFKTAVSCHRRCPCVRSRRNAPPYLPLPTNPARSTKGNVGRGKRNSDQKPSGGDPHEKLAVSLEGKAEALAAIEAAHRRLQMFSTDEEAARHDIRSRGEAEFDSLLIIGNDSISTILRNLLPKELCQSELVCKMFKRQSKESWKIHDKKICFNKSIVSHDPKTRFLRYFRSSEYAKTIEIVAKEHDWGHCMDLHDDIRIFRRKAKDRVKESDLTSYPYCRVLKQEMILRKCSTIMPRAPCPFPNHLTTLKRNHTEAFVRVISPKGVCIFEGFCPVRFEDPIPHVNLRNIPCPGWPRMTNIISKIDDEVNTRNVSGKSLISDLRGSIGAVTIVCLTDQHEPKLVASVSDFWGGGGYIHHFERRGWISNEWGRISGGVALKPHEEMEDKSRLPFICTSSIRLEFGPEKRRFQHIRRGLRAS